MTTAGGVLAAQALIVDRSAAISMFVGAALFLLVKVTLYIWVWFPTGVLVLSVFPNLESPHQGLSPPKPN